jgi:N-acetylmuramoyl-L-alanine amidase
MFKLALNAGHGINTAGKRCMKKLDPKQTREWTLNSRICEKIEIKLRAYAGYNLIRLDDVTGKKDIALKQRTDTANNFKADFYLSIHHNAGVKGGTGGGIVTYVYTKADKDSVEWQNALYKSLIEKTDLKGNRSNGTRKANLHECRESNMPCVLVEAGFMDSKVDVPIILTDKFADQVAEACVEVIVKKAKLKKKPTKTETKTEPKKETTKKDNEVLNWQKSAIQDGFKFPEYGADGHWGAESEAVAKKAICKKQLVGYKYKNLTKIVQKAVGVSADGKFGNDTKKAVITYQKKHKLIADGCVGVATWKKILGVK